MAVNSAVYYQGRYWNNHAAVRRHLNERATGDPKIVWYRHAQTFVGHAFEKALVLNCGNGWVERDILGAGVAKEGIGVDVAPDLLEQARTEAGRQHLTLRYYEVDVNRAVFPEDGYDLVVNHAALHHVTRLDRVLRALCRLLPYDGWLVSWDYVGPHRNQYSPDVMEAAHAVNIELPAHLRADLRYPHLPTMLVTDPSEAVHSELIEITMGRYFDIRYRRTLGGAIAY